MAPVGFSLSWFAVRGLTRDAALTELGVEPSGRTYVDPPRFGVADLPGGWLLFVFDDDLKQAFAAPFVALSKHGPAVACAIEEHVMFQEARGFDAGAEVWRVTHDPNAGESLYHLDVEGAPPIQLEEIRTAAMAAQDAEGGEDADVDLIADVPLKLARSLCGYKHDEVGPEGMSEFMELRRPKATGEGGPVKTGFFARLFGRG